MKKILVVDDDPHIRDIIRFALEKAGFAVTEAEHGVQALSLFAQALPDLVILDVLMPEMDGTEVCRKLRTHSQVPVIFLSSKDDEIDRIIGLELGGDDYMGKPFSPRELTARVRSALRRQERIRESADGPAGGKPALLKQGSLTLNPENYQVRWGELELALTVTEFGILRTLLQRPGKVFTRDELMHSAYTDFNHVVSDRTIDSHVRRVRQKLTSAGAPPSIIDTVHGLGYKLSHEPMNHG